MKKTGAAFVVTRFPAFAKAITPSDGELLMNYENKPVPMTVYVGGEGFVNVVPVGNDDAQPVLFFVPSGGLVPVECRRVLLTDTSATNLVGLF